MRPFTLVAALAVALVLVTGPPAAAISSGSHMWHGSVFSTGGSGDESAVAVTTNAAGQPIVVGSAITSAAGDLDIRICSWTALGVWRWTSVENSWDNPSNPSSDDTVAGVVVDDAARCAYVAGTTQGLTTGNDIVLLKIADGVPGYLGGEVVWTAYASSTPARDDEAEAVARDKAGNVYVTGGAERADGTMDVITVKFRPDGSIAWKMRHNNSTTRFDRGLAITVYGSSVYVAGLSNRRGHGDDLVLLKYTTGGRFRWARYFDDPLNRHESVEGVAADAGAVYVCGSGKATATKPGDALLVKYLSDGRFAWAKWAAGNGGGNDAWSDIALDARGRPHVTGYQTRAATGADMVTALYRTDGLRAWQVGYSVAGVKKMDVGTGLALDANGRTYVSGYRTGSDGDTEAVAVKYGTTGTTLWSTWYPDPAGYPIDPWREADAGPDWATDIALSSSHAYVVGGQEVDHAPGLDADVFVLAIQR